MRWEAVQCCSGCGAAPARAGLAGLGEAGRPWQGRLVWGGRACQKISWPAGPTQTFFDHDLESSGGQEIHVFDDTVIKNKPGIGEKKMP